MREPSAPDRSHYVRGQLETLGRGHREVGDPARVTKRVGRFEVDEVCDREQRRIETLPRQQHRERRLGSDHSAPGRNRVEASEQCVRLGAHQPGDPRIELLAGPIARNILGGFHAAEPVGDLEIFRQLNQPRRDRDPVASQLTPASRARPTTRRRRRPPAGPAP